MEDNNDSFGLLYDDFFSKKLEQYTFALSPKNLENLVLSDDNKIEHKLLLEIFNNCSVKNKLHLPSYIYGFLLKDLVDEYIKEQDLFKNLEKMFKDNE